MSAPVSGHQRENAGLFSSARQNVPSAAVQKKIESGSMVMTSPPALKIGVQLISTTVQSAVFSLKKRRASPARSRLVPSASRGLNARMPNSDTPKRRVLSQIVEATPGPLLK